MVLRFRKNERERRKRKADHELEKNAKAKVDSFRGRDIDPLEERIKRSGQPKERLASLF